MRKEPSLRHFAVVNMPLSLLKILVKRNSLGTFLNAFLKFASDGRHNRGAPEKYTIIRLYETVSVDILLYVFVKDV